MAEEDIITGPKKKRSTDAWRHLDWLHVCALSPEISEAFRRSSYKDFHEFVFSGAGLDDMAQCWWDTLTDDSRKRLLSERLFDERAALSKLKQDLLEEGDSQ